MRGPFQSPGELRLRCRRHFNEFYYHFCCKITIKECGEHLFSPANNNNFASAPSRSQVAFTFIYYGELVVSILSFASVSEFNCKVFRVEIVQTCKLCVTHKGGSGGLPLIENNSRWLPVQCEQSLLMETFSINETKLSFFHKNQNWISFEYVLHLETQNSQQQFPFFLVSFKWSSAQRMLRCERMPKTSLFEKLQTKWEHCVNLSMHSPSHRVMKVENFSDARSRN